MKLTLKHAVATIILVLSLTASAVTAWGCSQPDAPFCATQYGAFDGTDDFDTCKREMESYQSDVESFLSCQRSEIEDLESKKQARDPRTQRRRREFQSASARLKSHLSAETR